MRAKRQELVNVCGNLSRIPLYIFDSPNAKPSDIRKDFRALNNVKLVVVDYIGLMDSDRKFRDNRNLELGAISRDLKNLAKELDVPIVCLSQLNREKGEGEEPNLRDLRDSGELEQNASKVIFIWEVQAFDDGTKNVGVSVAKNRRGRLGAVKGRIQRRTHGIHGNRLHEARGTQGREENKAKKTPCLKWRIDNESH